MQLIKLHVFLVCYTNLHLHYVREVKSILNVNIFTIIHSFTFRFSYSSIRVFIPQHPSEMHGVGKLWWDDLEEGCNLGMIGLNVFISAGSAYIGHGLCVIILIWGFSYYMACKAI